MEHKRSIPTQVSAPTALRRDLTSNNLAPKRKQNAGSQLVQKYGKEDMVYLDFF